jgi:hypothetical protein
MDEQHERHGNAKSYVAVIRGLHRDIGFFVLGLTLIYALSGVALLYRETTFLKAPEAVETSLPPQLSADAIGKNLHLRRFELLGQDDTVLRFQALPAVQDGRYETATGKTTYTEMKLPFWLQRFIRFHTLSASRPAHWLAVAYGAALLFLAISSFFMFKRSAPPLRRGLVLAGGGLVLAALVLVFC